jgi:hypothetical protein
MSSVARAALRVQLGLSARTSVVGPGVEVFDLDAVGAELGHLGTDVADLPCRLGLLAGGPTVLLVTSRSVPLPHPEHDGIFVLSDQEDWPQAVP